MILNNYLLLKAYITRTRLPLTNETSYYKDIGLVATNGESCPIYAMTQSGDRFDCENWSLKSHLIMNVGTGQTEPTVNDTCLESSAMSSLTDIQVTSTTSSEDGVKTVITMSGRNTTGSNLTLTEVGVIKQVCKNWSYGFQRLDVLMVRELLEEPIVVPGHGSFSLTFEWKEA